MRKQIAIIFLLFTVLSLMIVPHVSATSTLVVNGMTINPTTTSALETEHPSNDASLTSIVGNTFQPSASGYITQAQVNVYRSGSPTGFFEMVIYDNLTGSFGSTAVPINTDQGDTWDSCYDTSDNMVWAGDLGTGVAGTVNFYFDGMMYLNSSKQYAWGLRALTPNFDVGNVVTVGGKNGNQYSGDGIMYYDGAWDYATYLGKDFNCYIWVSDTQLTPTPTPVPTATPSPSPTPFTYQGDIWAALSPYANILLPLVLIIFIALLCGKYGGVWGFFAGLNVTAILVYAIMGAAYMPLWGLVMLALVDGLLLFGKISGRM